MDDELLSRRSRFREGTQIRLADGQLWTFPSPPKASAREVSPFGTEYTGLIQALHEAGDRPEEVLTELALAIYLLGHNYSLSPEDYQRLLGTKSECPDPAGWQVAFHDIAQEHLRSFRGSSHFLETSPLPSISKTFARLLDRLRRVLPSGFR